MDLLGVRKSPQEWIYWWWEEDKEIFSYCEIWQNNNIEN